MKLFIGNIRILTQNEEMEGDLRQGDTLLSVNESSLHKENSLLIGFNNGGFVDIDKLSNIFDYIKMLREGLSRKYKPGSMKIPTVASNVGDLFVDENTLIPCKRQKPNYRTLKKIKTL